MTEGIKRLYPGTENFKSCLSTDDLNASKHFNANKLFQWQLEEFTKYGKGMSTQIVPKLPYTQHKGLPEFIEQLEWSEKHDWKTHFLNDNDGKMKFMWLGHATCLLRIEGSNVLIDPVFSDYCGPTRLTNYKRDKNATVKIGIKELPEIDVVIISHDHYDHLDVDSVVELNKKFSKIKWLVGDGLKKWFIETLTGSNNQQTNLSDNIEEFKWWEYIKYRGLDFCFLPAQHWCGRTLFDKNQRLWGGWAIFGKEKRFYYTGDTGYHAEIFNQINSAFASYKRGDFLFDLSAIPIGAYEPRDMMKLQHIDPKEALKIHDIICSKLSIGIHWGTFQLSYESLIQPRIDLELGHLFWEKHGRKINGEFKTINFGVIESA